MLFTAITFIITIIFDANVEAQGGAYATGVLVLMTSAAVAVTLSFRAHRRLSRAYSTITVVFLYTTAANIVERPDGVKIASWFIVTIIVTSLVSRVLRSTELRVQSVEPDETARHFLHEAGRGPIRIIANRPDTGQPEEYELKLREASDSHPLAPDEQVLSSRSGRETSRNSAAAWRSKALKSGATACCGVSARRSRTPLRRCSSTSATKPGRSRTRTSGGPKGIPWST